ncbi:fructosamine kinase family protein [Microlunatus capsulatus]|uniref:Fructosamine-3-kinase n=1 Tax=Microlunatus capsulatus TaxID=99117 RepID=A0ABS4Z7B4_9ACTN|nr:fructosamine kinase family protein [Microlunatus capsulatus]MBP2416943.1 fructosamine-3-kinase [Microlunatus capsulatus]
MTSAPGEVFTKHDPDAAPGFFAAEAAGLAWLAAAGPGAAAVVEVRAVTADRLVLQRLHPIRMTRTAARELGAALALTHAAGADAFGTPPPGRPPQGWIGRQPMSMVPTPTWGRFYAEQRVLPFARAAARRGTLRASGLRAVERVADRLVAGELDDGRPPARLHGDLWSGNVVPTADGIVLIDPAAHGGHGLTDLAMLDLFGLPELAAVMDAYAAAADLDAGWRDLLPLHQLHPLLVHAVSHGAGYGDEAERAALRSVG